jgi:acyl carrier protein
MHGNIAHSGTQAAPRRQSSLAQRPAAARKAPGIEHADAMQVLANATGISRNCIFARTRLEDIIGDSLVMEVVVLELEEFLGREADRAALRKLETVEDLSRHILTVKA